MVVLSALRGVYPSDGQYEYSCMGLNLFLAWSTESPVLSEFGGAKVHIPMTTLKVSSSIRSQIAEKFVEMSTSSDDYLYFRQVAYCITHLEKADVDGKWYHLLRKRFRANSGSFYFAL